MRNKLLALTGLLFILTGCGNKGEVLKFKSVKEESFQKYVNQKDLPASPNLSLDTNVVNDTYPITIALYKDNKFYYDLPNLGDGNGTWKYSDGRIELNAQRDIFDMYIEVHSLDEKADKLVITFIDRFGRNAIKMINNNMPQSN